MAHYTGIPGHSSILLPYLLGYALPRWWWELLHVILAKCRHANQLLLHHIHFFLVHLLCGVLETQAGCHPALVGPERERRVDQAEHRATSGEYAEGLRRGSRPSRRENNGWEKVHDQLHQLLHSYHVLVACHRGQYINDWLTICNRIRKQIRWVKVARLYRLPEFYLCHDLNQILLINSPIYCEEGKSWRGQRFRKLNDQEKLHHELLHLIQWTAFVGLLADVLLLG